MTISSSTAVKSSFGTRLASMAKTFSQIVDSIAETQEHTALRSSSTSVSASWSENSIHRSSPLPTAKRTDSVAAQLRTGKPSLHDHETTARNRHVQKRNRSTAANCLVLVLWTWRSATGGQWAPLSQTVKFAADFEYFPFLNTSITHAPLSI